MRKRRRSDGPPSGEGLLTPAAAAARLAISPRTLERWRADGFGPPYFAVGRRSVRYSVDDLDSWLRVGRRLSPRERESSGAV